METIQKITSSKMIKFAPPEIKLMLRMKQEITNNERLFMVIFSYKLFNLWILVNQYSYSFSKKEIGEKNYLNTFIWILEFFSSFRIWDLSFNFYYFLCLFFLFIICFFSTLYGYLYYRVKRRYKDLFDKSNKLIIFIIKIVTYLFMLVTISSQFLIYFFTKIIFNFMLFYFHDNKTGNNSYLLLVINSLIIIYLNIFEYKAYIFLNEPYFNSKFPIQMRNDKKNLISFIIILNFISLQHFKSLIDVNSSFGIPFQISVLILNFIIFSLLLLNLNKFNFQNRINILIKFFLILILVSYLIEEIIKNTFVVRELKIFIFLIFIKIIISLTVIFIHKLYLISYFKKKCSTSLFKLFQSNLNSETIECLYYFQSLFIEKKSSNIAVMNMDEEESFLRNLNQNNDIDFNIEEKFFDQSEKLMENILGILINHMIKCAIKNCNCNIIRKNLLIDNKLSLQILFENIYFQIGYSKKPIDIVLLFSDFLFFKGNSELFAYSILLTFINKNTKILVSQQKYHLYQQIIRFVESHHEKNKVIFDREPIFKNLFFDISSNKKLSKMIINFNNNFKRLLGYSEKFINDLRYNQIKNSGVLKSSNDIIVICENFHENFKKINNNIIKNYVQKEYQIKYELKYKVKLFYKIFSYKIPKQLQKALCFKSKQIESLGKSKEMIFIIKQLNFDIDDLPFLNEQFFNKILRNNQIIFEINKFFSIKYFSINLAGRMGYDLDYLIGNDIHIIFPDKLRENHKRVILQHLLVNKSVYFVKKTFAFTSYNKLLPILLKASPFPNLTNNIIYLANIELLEEEIDILRNNYHLILDGEFELISVTQNLEDNFCIYYELLRKLNFGVLKLFDIENQAILENFNAELIEISKEKYKVIFNSIFNTIFNLSISEDKANSNMKIILHKDNDDSFSPHEICNFDNNSEIVSNIATPKEPVVNISRNLNDHSGNLVKKHLVNKMLKKKFEQDEITESKSTKKESNSKKKKKSNYKKFMEKKNRLHVDGNTLSEISQINENIFLDEVNSLVNLKKKEPNSTANLNYKSFLNSKVQNYQKENNGLSTPNNERKNEIKKLKLDIKKISSKELLIKKDFDCLYKNLIRLKTKLNEYDPSDVNLTKLDLILDKIKKNHYFLKYRNLNITFNLRHFLYTPFFIVSIEEVDNFKVNDLSFSSMHLDSINNLGTTKNNFIDKNIHKNIDASLCTRDINITEGNNFSICSDKQVKLGNNIKNDFEKTKKLSKNNIIDFSDNIIKVEKTSYGRINERCINWKNSKANQLKIINKGYNFVLLLLILICIILILISNHIKDKHSYLVSENFSLFNLLDKQYLNLISIHSSIIGMLYIFSGLHEFNFVYELDYFKKKLKMHSSQFKDNKYMFYKSIVKNNFNNILNGFHHDFNVTKILLNWEEINYESNFDIETDKIISQSLSMYSYLNTSYDYNNIYNYNFFIKDINNNLLFDQILDKPKNLQLNPGSKFTEFIYYLNKNIPNGILNKFSDLKNKLRSNIDQIDNDYQTVIIICDVLYMLLFIITLVFIYAYIKLFNNRIVEAIFAILIINKDLDMNLKQVDEDILISRKMIDNYSKFVKIFNFKYYNLFFKSDHHMLDKKEKNLKNYQYKVININSDKSPKDTETTIASRIQNTLVPLYSGTNTINNQISVLSREISPLIRVSNDRFSSEDKLKFFQKKNQKIIEFKNKGVNEPINASSNILLFNNSIINNDTINNDFHNSNNIFQNLNSLSKFNNNVTLKNLSNNAVKNHLDKNSASNNLTTDNVTQFKFFETLDYDTIKNSFHAYNVKLVFILRIALIIVFMINFLIYISTVLVNISSFKDNRIFKDSTQYVTKRYSNLILINNFVRLSIFRNIENDIFLDPSSLLEDYEKTRKNFDLSLQNNAKLLIETNYVHNMYNKNFSDFSEIIKINNHLKLLKYNSKGIDISADNIVNMLRNLYKDFKKYKNSYFKKKNFLEIFEDLKRIVNTNKNSDISLQVDYSIELISLLMNDSLKKDIENIERYYFLVLYLNMISIIFEGLFYILFFYIAFGKLRHIIKILSFTSKRYLFRLTQRNLIIKI